MPSHCGLEKAFYENATASEEHPQRLVCAGRICEQKGQLLLVKAAALLAQKGLKFELVFAGDGEMRPEIEALVENTGLQKVVRITGISSEQVRKEILAARMLVLPSFAEGLPVVIM